MSIDLKDIEKKMLAEIQKDINDFKKQNKLKSNELNIIKLGYNTAYSWEEKIMKSFVTVSFVYDDKEYRGDLTPQTEYYDYEIDKNTVLFDDNIIALLRNVNKKLVKKFNYGENLSFELFSGEYKKIYNSNEQIKVILNVEAEDCIVFMLEANENFPEEYNDESVFACIAEQEISLEEAIRFSKEDNVTVIDDECILEEMDTQNKII